MPLRSTRIMLPVPSAEINWRWLLSTFFAAQTRQQFPKTHIAALLDHEAQRKECSAPAAVQFELAVRPIGQTMLVAEGRRVHGGRLRREHKENKHDAEASGCPR